MGYSTDFTGHVTVTPPLNVSEFSFLAAFADSRRMTRPEGPYSTKDYSHGQLSGNDLNTPPQGQPSLWCDWTPTSDGEGIEWNGVEKFHDADIWMQYLIDHFLKAGAVTQGLPGFEKFSFDHVVNGTISAQGEADDDTWLLVVSDNTVAKVDVESSRQRLESLLAEYRDRRRDGDVIPVELTDEIAELVVSVYADRDDD